MAWQLRAGGQSSDDAAAVVHMAMPSVSSAVSGNHCNLPCLFLFLTIYSFYYTGRTHLTTYIPAFPPYSILALAHVIPLSITA
jgi:hypothetical protein